MNLNEINTKITFSAGVSTANYPNSQRIIDVNNAIDEVSVDILSAVDGWDFDDKNKSDFPILTTDIVADQQDYSLPFSATGSDDDTIRIKRLETKLTNRFYKAEPFDKGERGRSIAETTDLANDFIESAPRYDMTGSSIFIYPVPTQNVTGGLRIWIDRSMANFAEADLTSTTKFPGFDRQFHKLVYLKVALEWVSDKESKNANKITTLTNRIGALDIKLKEWYGSKQQDREIIIRPAFVDYDTDRGNQNTNRRGPS